MTEQPESRWSLNHTGNRVLLAVAIALAVTFVCGGIAKGAAEVVLFALVAAVTYLLITVLHRANSRRR